MFRPNVKERWMIDTYFLCAKEAVGQDGKGNSCIDARMASVGLKSCDRGTSISSAALPLIRTSSFLHSFPSSAPFTSSTSSWLRLKMKSLNAMF